MSARALILACLLVLLSAAVVFAFRPAEDVNMKEEKPVKVMSREDAIGSLPCFKCHSLEDYLNKDEPGIFSHQKHEPFGIHCNKCHEVTGHDHVNIKGSTCAMACHSLELSYPGGGMGKVAFSHDFHTAMFKCSECHTDTFKMKKSSLKMDPMYAGKSCGKCHGSTATPVTDCTKCHKN